MHWVRVADDARGFVLAGTGKPFVPWGFNYDHDRTGRLIEDYWQREWDTVEADFSEMAQLGANVVRVHLQFGKFMDAPARANAAALDRLGRLLALAERERLYLDVTGLGCYRRDDVPEWYDAMDEAERWAVQAFFWEAVAETCAGSPAVFCYDLMNEPILPGAGKAEDDWLAGEFGGKHFVQRITLDLARRARDEVAKAWVDTLVAAIRRRDDRHMVTVGVIPWAHTWPGARPIFYSGDVGDGLDFVSVHFYPRAGEVKKALDALAVYDVGKPLVVEEMFPLRCGFDELDEFIDGSAAIAEGWISFYWGKTIEEYAAEDTDLAGAIMKSWLARFRARAPLMVGEKREKR